MLFLLALFLAWPTAGLSLVAYVCYAIFRSYVEARARKHDANIRHASRAFRTGDRILPSWADDESEFELFFDTVQLAANRKGVPLPFLWAMFQDGESLRTLMFFAGAMEREGATITEQQVGATDKVVEIWRHVPAEVRAAALAE